LSKLPVVSGQELIKYLARKGFVFRRQRGSHAILKSETKMAVVPLDEELARGTLLAILEQSGITKEEFLREWR